MSDMSIPILVLGIGMLVAACALALLLRQFMVSRQSGTFECSVQRRSLLGGESWQHGLMRFGTDGLRWFRAFSLHWRPQLVIPRARIDEVVRSRLPAEDGEAEDACLVVFALHGGGEIHAICDLASGAALNTWIEAAPTGMVRGDAD